MASSLCSQHDTQAIFQNFSGENKILDIEEAYAVQKQFVDIRLSQSRDEIAGYKVGLTSARMQRLLGIDSPIGGVVQKKEIRLSGAVVKKSSFSKVGLECEIIVLIGRDLPPVRDKKYEFDDIESSISSVSPGFELIDDRHADYKDIDVYTLVGDNSWNEGLVVGEFVESPVDLAGVRGMLERNGVCIETGKGADVLGHPFYAVQWLANTLTDRGLKEGDYVATGSIIPTIFPEPGESYCFTISDCGSVQVQIE